MEEPGFYILGVGLVVLALLIAAVGLRWEGFPASRGVLAGVIAGFAALVVLTAVFAWELSEDEQAHRETLQAEEAKAAGTGVESAEQQESEDSGAAPEVATVDAEAIFNEQGCSGCHTLAAAGSTASTGPDLDQTLPGKSPAEIETAIVDPDAQPVSGFPAGLMPANYGETLTPEELKGLVAFLSESTS